MVNDAGQPKLELRLARRFHQRLLGLLGSPPLRRHQALWILPCKAVHTWGMRYSIDVVFLDRCQRIVRIEHSVGSRRALFCLKAHSVVELAAGFCQAYPDYRARLARALAIAHANFPGTVYTFNMSKAFVKESNDDDEDDLGPEAVGLPAGTKNYITTQGYKRLRAELRHLMNEDRPSVVQVVSWAASNGDRSENGDYLYGKKRLREIDRRIRFLTKRLEIAEVVEPATQPNKDQVFFGATVLYSDAQGEEFRVTIVGVDEAEPLQGKISWISPVARALIKAREGDTVTLRTPAGIDELDILEVHYPDTPDDSPGTE